MRLESAYTKDQVYTLPDTNLERRDHIGYMLGYDRWVRMFYKLDQVPWMLSFQLWQDFIVNLTISFIPPLRTRVPTSFLRLFAQVFLSFITPIPGVAKKSSKTMA